MKNNIESDQPVRQLIKFSNYSLCITLPKEYIDDLGWQQGDRIAFELSTDNNLLLTRQEITNPVDTKSPVIPASPPEKTTITYSETPLVTEEPTTHQTLEADFTIDNLEPIPPLN